MNKSVLITGTAKGLGLALCKRFKEKGYTVYAIDLNLSEELKNLSDKNLKVAYCDISDFNAVSEAIKGFEIKALDIVVNNAGIWLDKNRTELLDDNFTFDTIIPQFKVNALGILHIAKVTLPLLQATGGVMINLSSEAGSISECSWRTGEYGYCMSKAAQNMATKIMSNAYGKSGVKFYALHPGWMVTDQGLAGASGDNRPKQNPYDTADKIIELAENPKLVGMFYDITTGEEMKW